ncbi:MAG: extracellular solute-binding protein [Spirochaetales bacterium]|nr:extracellular solute-binding protein [Spirochaetales bacterium]
MKKTLAIVLVVALAISAVFAQGAPEAAPAAQPEKMELVLLSAGKEAESIALIEAFNKEYPNITVTHLEKDSGDVLTLVQQKSSDSDVVLLIAQDSLEPMAKNLYAYKNVNDAKFDAAYKDAEGRWYACSMPLQTFMYNTDLLKGDDIPKSWYDLADPKYKGKIIMTDPSSSGSAYAQLYMMYKLTGDLSLAKAIAQNGTVYVTDSKAGPQAVARGEYALTMTGESNVSSAMKNGSPVTYLYPQEGTGRRIEGAGIIDGCKNLEAAKIFMDWFTGKGGAETIRSLGRRPVSTEVGGPDFLPALDELPFFEYDAKEAGDLKKQLRAEFATFL